MKPFLTIVFAALLPFGAGAQTLNDAVADPIAPSAVELEAPELLFLDAAEVDLGAYLWLNRVIVVFANSPNDPAFQQQVRYLHDREADLLDRDVVVVLDTDPTARSAARLQLRPRAFMLVIIGKDGEIKQRKPSPWNGREITQSIDSFPLRLQEVLERRPAGR
jgi:hypothetical protein